MWAVAKGLKGASEIQDYVIVLVLFGICGFIYLGRRLIYIIPSGIMLIFALAVYFRDEPLLTISAIASFVFVLDILAMYRVR
jgi:hypothetical protein